MKLIVLDIDGVLCFRKKPENHTELEKVILGKKTIWIRKGIYIFLDYIFKNFDVGIFSSTMEHNAEDILQYILTEDQYAKLVFKWFRDRTRLDPDYFIDPSITKYDTIKCLKDIIDSPIINETRRYEMRDIIMIDDSLKKLRFNEVNNYIIVSGNPEVDMSTFISDINMQVKY